MSVKYKITFIGGAERLFTLMSKLLPDDFDIVVEEIAEKSAQSLPTAMDLSMPKYKPKKKFTGRRHIHKFEQSKGINGIILGLLADGKTHRQLELRPLLEKAGYSRSSVTSRIENLQKRKLVHKMGAGLWRIVEPYGDKREDSLPADPDALLPHAAVLGEPAKA